MAGKSRLEGIAQRTDAQGRTRYRAQPRHDGERLTGSWTADPNQAIAERDQLLEDAKHGLLADRRLTVGEAVKEFTVGIREGWILNKKDQRYRASVVRLYTRRLSAVEKAFGAKSRLDAMRLPHVDRYRTRLRAEGANDSEIRNTIVAMRAMYAWACRSGYAVINPCVGLPMPGQGDRRPKRVATVADCSLLTACLVGRDRTAFALAWAAGLRAGEILGLSWDWIDLDARKIRVENAIDTATRQWVAEGPKTFAGFRIVPIRSQLLAILHDHADQYGDSGLLFPADRVHGDQLRAEVPMSYSALVQRLGGYPATTDGKRAHRRRATPWKDAGLDGLNLHEARHTFASMLIDAGAPPEKIKVAMGHSSIKVTYDVYGHLFPDSHDQMLALLDEYDEEQGL